MRIPAQGRRDGQPPAAADLLKLEFPVHPRTAADALGMALATERRAWSAGMISCRA
jgi:hypothetical protein